jgi:hypothetical protein
VNSGVHPYLWKDKLETYTEDIQAARLVNLQLGCAPLSTHPVTYRRRPRSIGIACETGLEISGFINSTISKSIRHVAARDPKDSSPLRSQCQDKAQGGNGVLGSSVQIVRNISLAPTHLVQYHHPQSQTPPRSGF